jgi:hypothetical protein
MSLLFPANYTNVEKPGSCRQAAENHSFNPVKSDVLVAAELV